MSTGKYTIGVDFGTDSVRTIVADVDDGRELAGAVSVYRRWTEGKYCSVGKNQFRQHPLDYIESFQESVKKALSKFPHGKISRIAGMSLDTTGSTPCAVDEAGMPLSLKAEFKDNPNAMFVLWKDHSAVEEAEEINSVAKSYSQDYTKYSGGVYSSEWFWAKILHILRKDKKIQKSAFSWVEHCDWMPALLTGVNDARLIKRSRCAAGHKAMWHESFGGLPPKKFLEKIDPLLEGVREKLYKQTYTVDYKAGTLSRQWAEKLGLSENVVVGIGAFDAHIGAIGAQIKPNVLCKVIGTSTCDILVAPKEDVKGKLIKGICGQVDGSVIPGMVGMEAGQSAFGDVYAWFKDVVSWPVENLFGKDFSAGEKEKIIKNIIPELSKAAAEQPPGKTNIIALDWINGRRTPYANQFLKGAITGLDFGSDAVAIFKALVEATAFGAKKIVDRFAEEGIEIKSVIALGGVAKKSPFVMQVLSDILGMNIKVVRSEEACALGAAMCAAVASGVYSTVQQAQEKMGNGFEKEYKPDIKKHNFYKKLYNRYSKLAEFIEKDFTYKNDAL
ncbi:MAG: ribulokinase [Candidatus Ratteibacteria bacterium]|nr:ribulokinase [Candidatus Ratteibacteria bacterium]